MGLYEEVKTLSGNKRRFFLLTIADMDVSSAMKLVGVTRATYNNWLNNGDFVALYRRKDEFRADHKQEAIQMLRRDNQLEAVLLEGKIIAKMKAEIDNGEYDLIRSNLAREVYSKLITDLDTVPHTQVLTWEQRIQNLYLPPQQQIAEGEMIEGEVIDGNSEAEGSQSQELTESHILPQVEATPNQS